MREAFGTPRSMTQTNSLLYLLLEVQYVENKTFAPKNKLRVETNTSKQRTEARGEGESRSELVLFRYGITLLGICLNTWHVVYTSRAGAVGGTAIKHRSSAQRCACSTGMVPFYACDKPRWRWRGRSNLWCYSAVGTGLACMVSQPVIHLLLFTGASGAYGSSPLPSFCLWPTPSTHSMTGSFKKTSMVESSTSHPPLRACSVETIWLRVR